MNYIRLICIVLLFLTVNFQYSQDSSKIYGVTIDNINHLSDIVEALSHHSQKMTARVVFDEWVNASEYLEACKEIHKVSFVMGEILDSYLFSTYNHDQYVERVKEYLKTLDDYVDIWEIGNEVNGEWLGNITDVVSKINSAYEIVKGQNKKIALTLHYNKDCLDNPKNEMFYWVNENLAKNMRDGIDYLFVSYYEDDCNNNIPNWQTIFDSLHVLFPNSKLGIGECGTKIKSKKESFIKRYYSMEISTHEFVGGYFWWYYKKDCVPYTKSLWKVLDNQIK